MGGRAGTRGVLFLFPITCSASAKKAFTQLKVEQCGSHSNAWVSEIHSFIYQVLILYRVWVCQAAWWLLELQCERKQEQSTCLYPAWFTAWSIETNCSGNRKN